MSENPRHRYSDENEMPPSCLACQESWMNYQGVVLKTLSRLEKMADENQKIVGTVPVICNQQENILRRLDNLDTSHKEMAKTVNNLQLDQSRQKGIMAIIGAIAGLIAGGLIDFFLGKISGGR